MPVWTHPFKMAGSSGSSSLALIKSGKGQGSKPSRQDLVLINFWGGLESYYRRHYRSQWRFYYQVSPSVFWVAALLWDATSVQSASTWLLSAPCFYISLFFWLAALFPACSLIKSGWSSDHWREPRKGKTVCNEGLIQCRPNIFQQVSR